MHGKIHPKCLAFKITAQMSCKRIMGRSLLGNFMHSFGQITNIFASHTCHGYTPIFCKVDAKLLCEALHLHLENRTKYLVWVPQNNLLKQSAANINFVLTCCGFMPVKQNIPIWSVMWDQLRDDPSFFKFSLSWVRMEMIRSAIPLTSFNLIQGYNRIMPKSCYDLKKIANKEEKLTK